MNRHVRKILDNLYGPVGSIVFHVVVIFVLLKFVSSQQGKTTAEFETIIKEVETVEKLEELQKDIKELEDIPTVVDAVTPPTVAIDREPPSVDEVGKAAQETGDTGADLTDQLNIMESVSPLKLRGVYSSRSSKGREGALREHAGTMGEATEYAVKKALEWLKKHQYPDGSWGPYYPVAMTGLGVLTFLAHGETTSSPDYGDTVRRALKYLLTKQKNGVFWSGHNYHSHYPQQVKVYEHSIATYAISEAYGLTSIPFLKMAMEDAVQVMIDGQNEGGSWDYDYRTGPDSNLDVSLSGWHVQALEAAMNAGAENKGLRTAIEGGLRAMKALVDKDKSGRFRYSTREDKRSGDLVMTSVAVLCHQLTGHALDPEARDGLKAIQEMQFRWTKGAVPNQDQRMTGEWPFYAWYYITQARFHQGGRTWMTWNKQFAPLLCGMQNPDGSWCPPPAATEGVYGPVYCTTLSALMLEVYYRFLPTYKAIDVDDGQPKEPAKGAEDDEVVIKLG